MTVIQCPPENPHTQQQLSAPLLPTRSRGQHHRGGTISTTPSPTPGSGPEVGGAGPGAAVSGETRRRHHSGAGGGGGGSDKAVVTVFTDTVEILRLLNMQVRVIAYFKY